MHLHHAFTKKSNKRNEKRSWDRGWEKRCTKGRKQSFHVYMCYVSEVKHFLKKRLKLTSYPVLLFRTILKKAYKVLETRLY